MAAVEAKPKAPTPQEVDALAIRFLDLNQKLLEAILASRSAQEPLSQMKTELVDLVSHFGSAHAEKSKLLHGAAYEMMATFGMSSSTDAAAVEKFRLALVKAKQARLLKQIFQKTTRWDLSPQAGLLIRDSKLSKTLLALYSQCSVMKPKTPTLDVRKKKDGVSSAA